MIALSFITGFPIPDLKKSRQYGLRPKWRIAMQFSPLKCAVSTSLSHPQLATLDLSKHDFSSYVSDLRKTLLPRMQWWNAKKDPERTVHLINMAYRLFVAHAPQALIDELLRFPYSPDAPVALVVQGLPVDEPVPPTPIPKLVSEARIPMAEAVLLGCLRVIGIPIVLPDKDNVRGGLVYDMVASGGDGVRSYQRLHLHRDFAAQVRQRTWELDSFALLALRGDATHKARTTVVSHRALAQAADPSDLELLRKARVYTEIANHSTGEVKYPFGATSWQVVDGSDHDPVFTFYVSDFGKFPEPDITHRVGSETPGAVEAYHRLVQIGTDLADEVDLQKGSLLLINNLRCTHGRTSYTPLPDGDPDQRWLVKAFVSFEGWRRPGALLQGSQGIANYPSFESDLGDGVPVAD